MNESQTPSRQTVTELIGLHLIASFGFAVLFVLLAVLTKAADLSLAGLAFFVLALVFVCIGMIDLVLIAVLRN